MSKIIYDVIQRFEVENGVPRLVSTNIQVIQGGEDLLSLAIDMLIQMGFYEKFEEKRTSQYIGYRLKNAGKGEKRYQVILAQRIDKLFISISQNILQQHILEFKFLDGVEEQMVSYYWIRPSKAENFMEVCAKTGCAVTVDMPLVGNFDLDQADEDMYYGTKTRFYGYEFMRLMKESDCCLVIIGQDQLFHYTWQVGINSKEVLEEFLGYFGKILMEQNQCLSKSKG
ncbi:hypothetical protein ACE1CD_03715 [Aerosakkonema sp. BLCC-F183]|uniref:hypothetical protein n=1 Tax=Aerosakkonema sp. BLCC-F183 TaxID=3342834 RepID=UPI0035BA4391